MNESVSHWTTASSFTFILIHRLCNWLTTTNCKLQFIAAAYWTRPAICYIFMLLMTYIVHKIVTTSIASSALSSQSWTIVDRPNVPLPLPPHCIYCVRPCPKAISTLIIHSVFNGRKHPRTSCMCRQRCMKGEYLFQMMKVRERHQRKVQNLGPSSAQVGAVGSSIMQLQD